MPGREPPPLLGTSHFRVLIGRHELAVAEVGPLATRSDLVLPPHEGVPQFETVVLRRALGQTTDLFDWRRRIMSGKKDRRTVTIHQLGAAGGPTVNTWRLDGAWPCRWSGPSFDALGQAVAVEELELAFDDLVWLAPPTAKPSRSRTKTEGA